jgi:hypothetical protein
MIKVYLRSGIRNKKTKEWFNKINTFFILAIGRSGTQFLSYLLNKAQKAYVVHEPVRSDFRAYLEAFYSEKKAFKYFNGFRKDEIYLRARNKDLNHYGEVNSVLRRHCNAIKKVLPGVKLFHLIRDGRDVVRSMMSRKTMTKEDPNTHKIKPKKYDLLYDNWSKMNRFERLCWYWDTENRYLMDNIENLIQFENLTSSYEYFRETLLIPLGLNISESFWEEEIKTPKNITVNYELPHWTKWDQKRKSTFNAICGKTMNNAGYFPENSQ